MYWKRMHTTIWSLTKSCKTCQNQSETETKVRPLTIKNRYIITVPWRALCVDLIGPYTLKGKDGTIIDFMALTMINLA
jgi:hypothetical protein